MQMVQDCSRKSTPTKKDQKPSKACLAFFRGWAESNIFLFRRWDGMLYGFLYILIPIIITFVSLTLSENELILVANCYLMLIINAANCFYDALGRWDDNVPLKKWKLGVLFGASIAVFVYGFIQLVAILGFSSQNLRRDGLLCLYLPAVAVTLIDILALSAKRAALRSIVND